MYQPPHFREDRLDILHGFIRAQTLGMLVTSGRSGLLANPIPFLLDVSSSTKGVLKAHLSRANPQWRDIESGAEALVIFQGVDTYITPSWYETKRETGKVVPTWNYAVVQAAGPMTIMDDPNWVRAQIGALTAQQEGSFAEPWAVSDAPDDFVAAQLKGIVGVQIAIARIEGKWKVSQNRPEGDRLGVSEGLRSRESRTAQEMADLVDQRGVKS
ncbi:FMN-binding negative transcriptional regulator [Microvirga puerhi]|uniref:FMN-binding negative transcriptional regulator n=1 Tax=Microvirga puerhi TaxID=2876078 RepID=A0ABS7VLV4_9HYPH|nr:FMN-binding negative transcriptional regulator [Microvirga puerhi]MBZ6076209.1 FMN-binding negative transcriptional regulator [Microvirga puerhi]